VVNSSTGKVLNPPWIFRGEDFGRTFNLTDGIFAFSMTLLVLGLALPVGTQGPNLTHYLLSSTFLTALFGYVITFFVIGSWWRVHQLHFGYIRSYDRRLVQFNLIFLIFIAILPFATEVLNASGSQPAGVVFFALIQVACGLALGGMWTYASGPGHLTDPGLPKAWARYLSYSIFAVPLVFAVSIPLAFITPEAEYLWAAVFFLPALLQRWMGN
jgi:uncharacterized membrane protein